MNLKDEGLTNTRYNNDKCLNVRGMNTQNKVFKLFFSKENMKRIQKKIKEEVYRRTRGKYKMGVDQNERSLIVKMEEVYKHGFCYLSKKPVKQTKELNNFLLEEIVPEIISSIKMQYKYLEDINSPINPIPRPQSTSVSGRAPLRSISSVYGF